MLAGIWRSSNLCTVGGIEKFYDLYVKQYGGSSKKKKKELPCDTAVLLMGIYPKESRVSGRCLHTHAYISTISNSQETETAQI